MTTAARIPVVSYIALGANLGNAASTLRNAIAAIAEIPATLVLKTSSLYQSAPLDAAGPDFVNAVIGISTFWDAHQLLLRLQQIEAYHGRLRPYPNAPRTLDLDVLLYGQQCIDSATLQVPHPRMWQRAFVLLPLAEIAPGLVNAVQLAAVSDQVIERLG